MNFKILKKLGIILVMFFSLGNLISQSNQDCTNSFRICDLETYHFSYMAGFGSQKDDILDLRCSDELQETNSYWLNWKVEKEGVLTFVINPHNESDDFDFVLFKSLDSTCVSLEEVRCMASGKNYGSQEDKSDPCLGRTGLSIQSLDDFEKSGCKFNDDNYLKFLNVQEGEIYYLFVNNFNSSTGFSISFDGDCNLYQDSGCKSIDSGILNLINIYPNPAQEYINVEFISESHGKINLSLHDILGRSLKDFNAKVSKGFNSKRIDIDDFPRGTYILRLSQGNKFSNKTFIKN